MKLSVLFFTFIATMGSLAQARISIDVPQSNEPVYMILPNAHEREDQAAKDKQWTRLGANLEIIATPDGKRPVTNETLLTALKNHSQFQTWLSKHALKETDFDWLIVRNIDVGEGTVQNESGMTIVTIPLAYDIRYSAMVPVLNSRAALNRNGTLEVLANLTIKLDQTGRVQNIVVKAYDDSQKIERYARTAGFVSIFDQDFVQAVSIPALETAFADAANLKTALEASGVLNKGAGDLLPKN